MNRAALVLCPEDSHACVDNGRMESVLQSLQIIDTPFEYLAQACWSAGDGFTDHITFLGCLPHLILDVEEGLREGGHAFCYLRLGQSDIGVWLRGANTRHPRCPNCRKTYRDWESEEATKPLEVQWTCGSCGAENPMHAFDWRQQAGISRSWIEVWGVFPSEGLPSDALLKALFEATDQAWTYFYCQP